MAPKLLPGEYRRRSLVSVEMDRFEAAIFAPEKLEALDKRSPGRALQESAGVEENYIVKTSRLDGVWTISLEHDGVTTNIPGKVLERMIAQRKSIIEEHRKRVGQETAAQRARMKAGDGRVEDAEAVTEDLDDDQVYQLIQGEEGRA